jgi:hypothetical protein
MTIHDRQLLLLLLLNWVTITWAGLKPLFWHFCLLEEPPIYASILRTGKVKHIVQLLANTRLSSPDSPKVSLIVQQ